MLFIMPADVALNGSTMASFDSDVLKMHDVNVGDLEIQEVEIEYIPIDMPVETVETSSDGIDNYSMLNFNGLTEPAQEIVLQETEVEVEDGDNETCCPDSFFNGSIVPAVPEIEVSSCYSLVSYDRRGKGRKNKSTRGKVRRINESSFGEMTDGYDLVSPGLKLKSQQIKLDGDFAVAMWTTGKNTTTLGLASIRISNGSPLVYYDHYTKLHIVATRGLDMIHIVNQYCRRKALLAFKCLIRLDLRTTLSAIRRCCCCCCCCWTIKSSVTVAVIRSSSYQ